jgi:hypothetical protein
VDCDRHCRRLGRLQSGGSPRTLTTASMHQTQLRPQVVLYGDSLTQFSFNGAGWGAGMAARYQVCAALGCERVERRLHRWSVRNGGVRVARLSGG